LIEDGELTLGIDNNERNIMISTTTAILLSILPTYRELVRLRLVGPVMVHMVRAQ